MLAAMVALYGCWFLFILAAQEFIFFFGAYGWKNPTDGPRDPEVEQIWLKPGAGTQVEAWFKLGRGRSAASPGPLAVFFHGNQNWVDDKWELVSGPYIRSGVSVLATEYRGYGRSTGVPSEAALIADAIAHYDLVVSRHEIDRSQIILHGNSVGGGIALAVAEVRPVRAIVLESTFYSMADLMPRLGMPAGVCRHPFRNDLRIAKVGAPILLIHGATDDIIPPSNSKRLAGLAKHARYAEFDGGHRNYRPLWSEIRPFLAEIGIEILP